MSANLYSNVDLDQWVYQQPSEARNGRGKTVYIDTSSTNRKNPSFQLPKCRVPFEPSAGLEPKPETTRWNVELSVDDTDLQDFFHRIDNTTLNWLDKNSVACFGRQMTREIIEGSGNYRPMLQQNNPNYAPVCRTKIVVGRVGDAPSGRSNITRVLVVTKEENGTVLEYMPGTKDDITRNCMVMAKVEVGGMWFVSGKCGMSLVMTDVLVWPVAKEEEFPFDFGDTIAQPKRVLRNNTYDPMDMETTIINMPPVDDERSGAAETKEAGAVDESSVQPDESMFSSN